MKITYSFGKLSAEKEVLSGDFILTNRRGSFYYSSLNTKFGGWFILEGEMFKILEGFSGDFEYLENNFYQINRKGSVLDETFFPFGENSLIYGSSSEVEMVLDIRKAFDNRVWGRNYKINVEDGRTIISFLKRTDKREDDSNGVREFEIFVVVNGVGSEIGEWVEKKYELDSKRNSLPDTRYVYRALKLKPGRYVISAGLDLEKVLSQNKSVSETWENLREKQKEYFKTFVDGGLENFCLQTALDSLVNHFDSRLVYAGLPWFFQEWSRDIAVSCKGLMINGEYELVKKILLEQLNYILDDGRLPSRYQEYEGGPLESADSIGWVFLRLGELARLGKLSDDELKSVKGKLVGVIEKLLTYHTKKGLAMNNKLETWMDTIDRSGACIEIQALRLRMYKLAFELTQDRKYKLLEDELKVKVRGEFWDDEKLVDRIGDLAARPNVFLAAYVYPHLLTKDEWAAAFEYVLERNFLNWGGLATIDAKDKRFVSTYSGENNKSYHNGDSWFWVNNLAALMMLRIDRIRFKDYIRKIFTASQNELLWSGAVGCSAELSSASDLKSEGCVLQAWSCSTLLELMEELTKKD